MNDALIREVLQWVPPMRQGDFLKELLRHNNLCEVWIGGTRNNRYQYPKRLAKITECDERIRDSAQELILDSAIGDPSIDNRRVVKRAIELDAQYVIPKDTPQDPQATHESLQQFLDIYEALGCNSKIIVPLQPPHDDHYQLAPQFYSQFSHFAVGGMRDAKPEAQIEAVKTCREEIGEYKWLHGLGMGSSKKVRDAILENDQFLDSFDVSAFEKIPGQYGEVADKDWNRQDFAYPSGDESSTLRAIQMQYLAFQAVFELSSFSGEMVKEAKLRHDLTDDWSAKASAESEPQPTEQADESTSEQSADHHVLDL